MENLDPKTPEKRQEVNLLDRLDFDEPTGNDEPLVPMNKAPIIKIRSDLAVLDSCFGEKVSATTTTATSPVASETSHQSSTHPFDTKEGDNVVAAGTPFATNESASSAQFISFFELFGENNASNLGNQKNEVRKFTSVPSLNRDGNPKELPEIEGLKYEKMPGDGDCLYHAVVRFIKKEGCEDELNVALLRDRVANYLERPANLEQLKGYMELTKGQTVEQYVQAIRTGKEWASHLDIEVLMCVHSRPIIIIAPNNAYCQYNSEVADKFLGQPIFVYFNNVDHYDALILTDQYKNCGRIIANRLKRYYISKVDADSTEDMQTAKKNSETNFTTLEFAQRTVRKEINQYALQKDIEASWNVCSNKLETDTNLKTKKANEGHHKVDSIQSCNLSFEEVDTAEASTSTLNLFGTNKFDPVSDDNEKGRANDVFDFVQPLSNETPSDSNSSTSTPLTRSIDYPINPDPLGSSTSTSTFVYAPSSSSSTASVAGSNYDNNNMRRIYRQQSHKPGEKRQPTLIDKRNQRAGTQAGLEASCMPKCPEQKLLQLIDYVESKNLNQTGLFFHTKASLDVCVAYLKQAFNHPSISMKTIIGKNRKKGKFRDLFNEAIRYTEKSEWSAALEKLQICLKELRPFNVQKLLYLDQRNNEASKTVKDKDIVLLLGNTGAGKSTLTAILAGAKIMSVNNGGGLWSIEATPESIAKQPILKQIKTNATTLSETCYLTAVPIINLQELEESKEEQESKKSKGSASNAKTLIVCDSPGLNDTRDEETDVENSLGMIRAIKQCRSVKPVLLVNTDGVGGKYEHFKAIIGNVSNMLQNISVHAKAFEFIFVKCNEDQVGPIHGSCKDLKIQLKPHEKWLEPLLDEVIEKTKERDDILFIKRFKERKLKIDNENGPGYSDYLDKIRKQIIGRCIENKAACITEPENVFQYVPGKKAREAMSLQQKQLKKTIKQALASKDFPLLGYKLEELYSLFYLLGMQDIKNTYDECRQKVTQKINAFCDEIVKDSKTFLAMTYTLKESDIEKYLSQLQAMAEFEPIRQQHLLGMNVSNVATLTNAIIGQVKLLINQLQHVGRPSEVITEELTEALQRSGQPGQPNDLESIKQLIDELQRLPRSNQVVINQLTKELEIARRPNVRQIEQLIRQLQLAGQSSEIITGNLDKIALLAKHFPALEKDYKKVLKGSYEKRNDFVKIIKNYILKNEFSRVVEKLGQLDKLFLNLDKHLDEKKSYYESIERFLLAHVTRENKNHLEKVAQSINNNNIMHLQAMDKWYRQLNEVNSIFNSTSPRNNQSINKQINLLRSKLKSSIEQCFNNDVKEIQSKINSLTVLIGENDTSKQLEVIKKETNELNALTKVIVAIKNYLPSFSLVQAESNSSLLKAVKDYINRVITKIASNLEQKNGIDPMLNDLNLIAAVYKAEWINAIDSRLFHATNFSVENMVNTFLQRLDVQETLCPLNLGEHDNLEKAKQLYQQVQCLGDMNVLALMPEAENRIDKTENRLSEKIIDTLGQIIFLIDEIDEKKQAERFRSGGIIKEIDSLFEQHEDIAGQLQQKLSGAKNLKWLSHLSIKRCGSVVQLDEYIAKAKEQKEDFNNTYLATVKKNEDKLYELEQKRLGLKALKQDIKDAKKIKKGQLAKNASIGGRCAKWDIPKPTKDGNNSINAINKKKRKLKKTTIPGLQTNIDKQKKEKINTNVMFYQYDREMEMFQSECQAMEAARKLKAKELLKIANITPFKCQTMHDVRQNVVVVKQFFLEQAKRGDDKSYLFEEIEFALAYLQGCQALPNFERQVTQLLTRCESCLHYRYKIINTDIRDLFNKIIAATTRNETERQALRALGRQLADSINKLQVIQQYSHINKLANAQESRLFIVKITNHCKALRETIEHDSKYNQIDFRSLQAANCVAEVLKCCDLFLASETENYQALYSLSRDKLSRKLNEAAEQIQSDLNNNKYRKAVSRFTSIKLNANSAENENFRYGVAVELFEAINDLCDKISASIKDGALYDAASIKQNSISAFFTKLDGVKLMLEEIKKKSDSELFSECDPRVLYGRLNYIESDLQMCLHSINSEIVALTQSYHFNEAEDKKQYLVALAAKLRNNSFNKQALEQQTETTLNKIADDHITMSIDTISPDLKHLIEALVSAKKRGRIYGRTRREIITIWKTKFQQTIDQLKRSMMSVDVKAEMTQLQQIVEHYPDNLQDELNSKLSSCYTDIEQTKNQLNRDLEQAIGTFDVKTLKRLIAKNSREVILSYLSQQVNQGRISQKIDEIIANRLTQMAQYKYKPFIKKCHDLFIIKNHYNGYYPHIGAHVDAMVLPFQRQCVGIFSALDVFPARLTSTLTQLDNNLLKINLSHFKNLLLCRESCEKDYQHNSDFIDMLFPSDFIRNVYSTLTKMSDFFQEIDAQYKMSLDRKNTDTMAMLCDYLKHYQSIRKFVEGSLDDSSRLNCLQSIRFTTTLKHYVSYADITSRVCTIMESIKTNFENMELINDKTSGFSEPRKKFYEEKKEEFDYLRKLLPIKRMYVDASADEQKQCYDSLRQKALALVENIRVALKKATPAYEEIRLWYVNIDALLEYFSYDELKDEKNNLQDEIIGKINELVFAYQNGADVTLKNLCSTLVNLRNVADSLPEFKAYITQQIDLLISDSKPKDNQEDWFGKLAEYLRAEETGIGNYLLREHSIFKGALNKHWNEITKQQNIDYVVRELALTGISTTTTLRKAYNTFKALNNKIVAQYQNHYLKNDVLELDSLITTILSVKTTKAQLEHMTWSQVRERVITLAANVFALWTLNGLEAYYAVSDNKNKAHSVKYSSLLNPHPVQVVAIFRMLGVDGEALENNLIQIGTGEGKSVTLAVTAIILVLLGFEVNVACYSKYLSNRDYLAFKELFSQLGLQNKIVYDTFRDLCEKIINIKGNIRKEIENVVLDTTRDPAKAMSYTKEKSNQILLIDEVDVFFREDFLGEVYRPAAKLHDSSISSLIEYIWENKDNKISLQSVCDSAEYQACVSRFKNWEGLLCEAVRSMLHDVALFAKPTSAAPSTSTAKVESNVEPYEVKNDKIGYKEPGGDVFYNIVYGYRTLFSYWFEYDRDQISKSSLQENSYINIQLGYLSYAEIPKQFYKIMGVTGTLKVLQDDEKKLIQDKYNMQKYTYMPSTFGKEDPKKPRFRPDPNIKVASQANYFSLIAQESQEKLKGTKDNNKRAVLLFFKDKKLLNEFYHSQDFSVLRGEKILRLTEEANDDEKNLIVQQASTSGHITLCTRDFCRGTDFVCYDKRVDENGGVHVIQTFFSEQLSEEIQTKGRTARQKNLGSYSLVLVWSDLEKFQISKDDAGQMNALGVKEETNYGIIHYDKLNEIRKKCFENNYEETVKQIERLETGHEKVLQFILALYEKNLVLINEYLLEKNQGPKIEQLSIKTMVLMDATGSMSGLLTKAKNTVGDMYDKTYEVLLKHEYYTNIMLEMMFTVYRNYNAPVDEILQTSAWTNNSTDLRTFMETIAPIYGWGHEAIEIGFWHANKEIEKNPDISQVLLIGDMPPNTATNDDTDDDSVLYKRKNSGRGGEEYWLKSKFGAAFNYKDQLKEIKRKKIPIHTFFVRSSAKNVFTEIAQETGGTCAELDVNSAEGAKQLTDTVAKTMLKFIGDSEKIKVQKRRGNALTGDQLVEEYLSGTKLYQ